MPSIDRALRVVPGQFVYTPRMAPVLGAYLPYVATQYSNLLPSYGQAGPYIAMTAGPSFVTAFVAAGAYRLQNRRYAFGSAKRHNRSLCIGAATTTGLEAYAVALKPVPQHPHGLPHLGSAFAAATLTVALLWTRKPERKSITTAPVVSPQVNPT